MTGADTVLWLDTSTWTAIGTLALVFVTAAYVIYTGRLAKSTAKSAEAAERSAPRARSGQVQRDP
jgi:hypothetical protein